MWIARDKDGSLCCMNRNQLIRIISVGLWNQIVRMRELMMNLRN
jgi:hypothetical protein